MAACAATSYGQGFISLDNYNYPGGIVTYGANVPANGVSGAFGPAGTGLNSAWTVGFYYGLGNLAITDPPSSGLPNGLLALGAGSSSTAIANSGGAAGIFFAGGYAAIPGGAVGGTVTLELVAYPTVDGTYFGTSTFRGHSAPFTLTMMAGSATPPTANAGPAFTTFGATSVPEPTTLALAGLGGLASLVAFRRKQA
jgi:hypothetical protein